MQQKPNPRASEADAKLVVSVPTSKSITQRALVLAALARGESVLASPLDCADSLALRHALGAMGVTIEVDAQADVWRVHGGAALTAPACALHLGNAGTAVRFITGLAPLIHGALVVDGVAAMQRRPMPGLLNALRSLGVAVHELGQPHCPPVRLDASAIDMPQRVTLHAGGSSQELTALMLLGAGLPHGLEIEVLGELPSWPYIELTMQTLRAFGVSATAEPNAHGLVVRLSGGPPRPTALTIEGDWSSASYPLAAGWLTGTSVRVDNVVAASAQGDRIFPDVLQAIATPHERTFDLGDTPDIVPTVVACALFAEGATAITHIAHLRIKESDRIAVLCRELAKLGADVHDTPDGLVIRPRPLAGPATLDPAHDHRMAMAFGLVGLRVPGLVVSEPECVDKSYPGFWQMLARFRPT